MAEKELYREKAEAKIRELEAKLDVLEAKASQAKAESKIEFQKQMEEVRQKRATLRENLDEMKKAGGEAWKDFKKGLEKATEEMKTALEKASNKFK